MSALLLLLLLSLPELESELDCLGTAGLAESLEIASWDCMKASTGMRTMLVILRTSSIGVYVRQLTVGNDRCLSCGFRGKGNALEERIYN